MEELVGLASLITLNREDSCQTAPKAQYYAVSGFVFQLQVRHQCDLLVRLVLNNFFCGKWHYLQHRGRGDKVGSLCHRIAGMQCSQSNGWSIY